MKCPEFLLQVGTKVVTRDPLDDTMGLLVPAERLALRKAGAAGVVAGVVGGHGGDVYWVKHGDPAGDDTAPYCWSEFDLETGQ